MSRHLHTALILWLLSFGIPLEAQFVDPGFAQHLISQGDYRSMLELRRYPDHHLTASQRDSMEFYTAWAYFHLQEINPAINHFNQVSPSSSYFRQSRVFSSWCNLYQGRSALAQKELNELLQDDGTLPDIAPFQHLAIQLYEKDYDGAESALLALEKSDARYQEQVDQLREVLRLGQEYQAKSQGLAALFSAIIPGTGKMYAGETGAGISTLLVLAGLGGVAAEQIIKSGWTSWNSILFTALFGTFYAGNIYGSIVSVQTYRNRFHENYNQRILATVVIPLRDFYR